MRQAAFTRLRLPTAVLVGLVVALVGAGLVVSVLFGVSDPGGRSSSEPVAAPELPAEPDQPTTVPLGPDAPGGQRPVVPAVPSDDGAVPNLADRANPFPSGVGPDDVVRLVVDDPEVAEEAVRTTPGVRIVDRNKLFVVMEVSGEAGPGVVEELRDAGVSSIEQDALVEATSSVTPTDPAWSSWWGARQVGLPQAWSVSQGSADVTIAIIDTGVSPVAELTVPAPGGAVAPVNRFVPGRSWTQGDPMIDENGHGTMSAVVAAGAINNAIGAGGGCPNCRIMPLQTLDASGSGFVSSSSSAVIWAVDNGADLISMSLGGPTWTRSEAEAVAYAAANGVPVVASAGNNGDTQQFYPAALPEVIGVAGIQSNGRMYDWSTRGEWVSTAAAGCNPAQNHVESVVWYCGTSSAAPLVSGALALLVGLMPDADVSYLRERIEQSSVPSRWVDTAWGVLDASALVTTPPSPPTGVSVVPGDGVVTVSWEAPLVDGGSPVLGYRVLADGVSDPVCETVSTGCVVSGLVNGVEYGLSVVAVNAAGVGAPSEFTVLLPVPAVPDEPGVNEEPEPLEPTPGQEPDPAVEPEADESTGGGGESSGGEETEDPGGLEPPDGSEPPVDEEPVVPDTPPEGDGITLQASCGFGDGALIPVWARQAACWLKAEGITTNNPYGPMGVVNRSQMAAFLWRLAGSPSASASCGFDDEALIPVWARQAACWLKAEGITTNNPYGPMGVVNRAQMAGFLYRAAPFVVAK